METRVTYPPTPGIKSSIISISLDEVYVNKFLKHYSKFNLNLRSLLNLLSNLRILFTQTLSKKGRSSGLTGKRVDGMVPKNIPTSLPL
jgi:hypothetical protein